MKCKMGQYLCVYKPEHHRATKEGYVYEHIIVAEEMLGRKLNPKECVHHKDENKYNNSISNLMVFKTKSDHTAFHHGCDIILDGDVYVAINKQLKNKNGNPVKICPICNENICHCSSNMCDKCRRIKSRKVERPSYDELLNLILTVPITTIGKMFNVSDNSVRKWCKAYGLPSRYNDIKMLKQNW